MKLKKKQEVLVVRFIQVLGLCLIFTICILLTVGTYMTFGIILLILSAFTPLFWVGKLVIKYIYFPIKYIFKIDF